jgi:undecaprenyl-phosphate galactose phosphotransferase
MNPQLETNVQPKSGVNNHATSKSEKISTHILEYNSAIEPIHVSTAYLLMKRACDICGALIGLGILLLLLPFIALLIWWEDRGPIFYRYVCIGQYNRPFTTYKIRSMMVNANEFLEKNPELLARWKESGKLVNDPRVTRIGRFIRATSIDELPQLLNVLRGEMSLVGPRFIQFIEVDRFGELIKLRQLAKPGLTGLWQVSGRSKLNYEQRAMLDCIYVIERSFPIDLLILFKTIPAVLHGVGAY